MSWVSGKFSAYNQGALLSALVYFMVQFMLQLMVTAPHKCQRCPTCQDSDRLGFVHGRNLLRAVAQLGQHFVGVLTQQR